MTGMQSATLQIHFLADLSSSVAQMQETMRQMQATLANIERGLELLRGRPVAEVIAFHCERELKIANAIPSKVYVPVDGVREGGDKMRRFEIDSTLVNKKVLEEGGKGEGKTTGGRVTATAVTNNVSSGQGGGRRQQEQRQVDSKKSVAANPT